MIDISTNLPNNLPNRNKDLHLIRVTVSPLGHASIVRGACNIKSEIYCHFHAHYIWNIFGWYLRGSVSHIDDAGVRCQIWESLLSQAFCLCSRKRALAAWLLCDRNWPITNASEGPPLASEPGSHYFETLLLQFGNNTDTESAERIMLHKIGGGCFLRLPEENGEQRAPKAEIVGAASFLVNAASSHLASIYLGQLGSTTSPCERRGPITAALGRTECPENVWWCSYLH